MNRCMFFQCVEIAELTEVEAQTSKSIEDDLILIDRIKQHVAALKNSLNMTEENVQELKTQTSHSQQTRW